MSEEELKQMSGDELIGIIKAQRFEIKEKNLLIQELRDTIDNQREEIDRLNNIIDKQDRKIKLAIKIFEHINKIYGESPSINDVIDELKENNK